MSLISYKIFAALVLFIITVLSVAYPIRARTRPKQNTFMELGDAFASGVFLGAALFHMLPDAAHEFEEIFGHSHFPLAEVICACGFVLLLFLERLSLNSSRINHKLTIPFIAAITLIIHSLIEGAALGVNTELATASVLFLAIFAHKASESFALSITLCRGNHLSSKQLFWIIGIFAIMTPVGIALGTVITSYLQFTQGQIIAAGFNAFAAGTFLYMSTLHHINHHQSHKPEHNLLGFVSLLAGLVLMGVIGLWL